MLVEQNQKIIHLLSELVWIRNQPFRWLPLSTSLLLAHQSAIFTQQSVLTPQHSLIPPQKSGLATQQFPPIPTQHSLIWSCHPAVSSYPYPALSNLVLPPSSLLLSLPSTILSLLRNLFLLNSSLLSTQQSVIPPPPRFLLCSWVSYSHPTVFLLPSSLIFLPNSQRCHFWQRRR